MSTIDTSRRDASGAPVFILEATLGAAAPVPGDYVTNDGRRLAALRTVARDGRAFRFPNTPDRFRFRWTAPGAETVTGPELRARAEAELQAAGLTVTGLRIRANDWADVPGTEAGR